MPTRDGREAASKSPTIPVRTGLHRSAYIRLHDPRLPTFGLPNAFAAPGRGRRRRRQRLHPDTLPPGVLVCVFSFAHDGCFMPDVLWQTVEPFTHGRVQPVHYDIETR